jgi:hypothetical protein
MPAPQIDMRPWRVRRQLCRFAVLLGRDASGVLLLDAHHDENPVQC